MTEEFNRKEILSLLSSVLDNLDDGKIKKNERRVVQDPISFLNWRDTFACSPNGHREPLISVIYQISTDCCACCTNGKAEKSAIDPICCGCFTAKGAHI